MAGDRSMQKGWSRLDPRTETIVERPDEGIASSAPLESTFISSGATFEGSLILKGDFHIDTEYRGTLETDGKITIGPNGSVVGNLDAREVVIQGAVVGDVRAPRQLVVEAHAKLHGDIETACLEIQKYAFFKGNTTMSQPQAIRHETQAHSGQSPALQAVPSS